jgi:glycosyltransferase involved in cell wall biosynthesis
VLFLCKYARKGASSRYRTLQYIPGLQRAGIDCTVAPLFDDAYLDHLYVRGKASKRALVRAYLRRARVLLTCHRYDLLYIEKELFPWLPAWIERVMAWRGMAIVVDYDDAIFHCYDRHRWPALRLLLGDKIAAVIRSATAVVAGNGYLADYASNAGARGVRVIPTVIDLDRYTPSEAARAQNQTLRVVWIGSPTTAPYLRAAAPALARAFSGCDWELVVVGAGPLELEAIPLRLLPWSEEGEVDILRDCDIGIMPLADDPWAAGKCGLKLIQYMACGLPVVASPVGINRQIVEQGVNGFLAADEQAWTDALVALRDSPGRRVRMGRAGRARVERHYCLQQTSETLLELIRRNSE